MSAGWYDSNYQFRVAISINASAKGTSPVDVTITIPTTLDHFWSNVLSSGADIRVTMADGQTLCTFDINGAGGGRVFSVASKICDLEIDNLDIQVSAPNFVWLYYGYASAVTATTTVTPSSAALAYIAQETPPADRIIVVAPERVDATKPQTNIQRMSGESTFVYLDCTDILMRRRDASGGQIGLEGIQAVYLSSTTAGADSSATYCTSGVKDLTRIVEHNGRTYVRVQLLGAGSSGTNVTFQVALWTMFNVTSATVFDQRKLAPRFQVTIFDVTDP